MFRDIGIVALFVCCFSCSDIAEATPHDQDLARRELQKLIAPRKPTSHPSAEDHLASMLDEEERNEDIILRIDRFLEKYPDDPSREQLLLAKLEAVYIAGTLRGRSFDRLGREIAGLLQSETAPRLRQTAEYWRMRLESLAVETGDAQTRADDAKFRRIGEYAIAHPKSPEVPGLLDELFGAAARAGDFSEAERWLAMLREHHPSHVTTLADTGEMNLIRQIGSEWRPPWSSLEGKLIAWESLRGKIGLVVFFSSRHGPSVEFLEQIAGRQPFGEGLSVIAFAVENSREAPAAVLSMMRVEWPLVCDGRGWKSDVCSQWGIRNLPTVLILDEKGILRRVNTQRRGPIYATVERGIRELRRARVTATSRSNDAPHSK